MFPQRTPAGEIRNYDPTPPPPDILARYGARVLDPATAEQLAGISPRSTVYVANRLLLPNSVDIEGALAVLRDIAGPLGLYPEAAPPRGERLEYGARVVELVPRGGVPTRPADAWSILQWVRARFGVEAVAPIGLDHLMVANGRVMAVPFQPQFRTDVDPPPPPTAPDSPALPAPSHASAEPEDAEIADYVRHGGGGRQAVAWLGPAPSRQEVRGRRPVVAILDTGCGSHPWLDAVVERELTLDGEYVGPPPPQADPEVIGSLDEFVDAVAGHGTFMAGLVHVFCPDADLIAIRVVDHEGVVLESDLVHALAQIIELVRRHRNGEAGGRPIDIVVLSMGYYHETPESEPFVPIIAALLAALGRLGVVVVAAAGNDATARPMYPAALAPWANGAGLASDEPDCVPVVSVGATNPDGAVALFSNDGPWVRAWEAGASVVSTMPVTFHGGLRPVQRTQASGKIREALDPDDYTSGFAVWSGTSFAAPVLAGRLASSMQRSIVDGPDDLGPADAVARARRAVAACTSLAQ